MNNNEGQQNENLAKLDFTLDRILAIIGKLNFADEEKKGRLIMLCNDIKYFLTTNEPELFPLYIAHNLRELIEKFFNSATNETLREKDYIFEFNQTKVQIKDVFDGIDYAEVINETGIKIIRLIEEDEFRKLLLISCEPAWQEDVWRLNERYGNKKTAWRILGSEIFLEEFTKSYVITEKEKESMIENRNRLYKSLSEYAHGHQSLSRNDLTEKNKVRGDIINTYLDTCVGVYEIFRPFEYQNTKIINKLKEIINEQG